jgi:tetratricopeptide (TPR) repeat protein
LLPVLGTLKMAENGQALSVRAQKVQGIFKQFDRNQDGCLNRNEMASLVIAVNPRVKFSKEQIEAILDEVFRTYGEFIDGTRGLSFEGLLRTYDDGAGDVDRDFDALGLQLSGPDEPVEHIGGEVQVPDPDLVPGVVSGASQPKSVAGPTSITNESAGQITRRLSKVGAWAKSPNHGILYDETWKLIEELELLLRRQDTKIEDKRKQREEKKVAGLNGLDTTTEWEDSAERREGVGGRRGEEELGADYGIFKKTLADLREKAGKAHTPDEAFDGHMAMGKSLAEHRWYEEALISFKLAVERKPQDVRAHFLVGNALYNLSHYKQARESYQKALEAGEENAQQWEGILPQVKCKLKKLMSRFSYIVGLAVFQDC